MPASIGSDAARTAERANAKRTRRLSWWWRRSRWTRIALSLSSSIIGIAILAIPFSPWLLYHALKPEPVFPYATKLTRLPEFPSTAVKPKSEALPKGNRLVIPKIGVDVEIVEGKDERALYRGIWHIPNTSSPDRGGNTVLTGHRFQYLSGPRTLYLLDQMQVGDVIIVYWKGVEYDYKVRERKIVNPDAIEILDNTDSPQLTVFTCTPIFTTKQRLVLFAEPLTT